jgi:Ras-related GTP-binding protein C/D
MGLRRSGKSSILKVVFHKMSPHETRHLESTKTIEKNDLAASSFVRFQLWDFPGQLDFFDPSFDALAILTACGALIFVIDAQEDYNEALKKLHQTVVKAHKVNPAMVFEVFIHKVDGLSDDHKIECQWDINKKCHDHLHEASIQDVQIAFHLTSIYDHSIFDAFSKVVQKLTPQTPTLDYLLDTFTSNSKIEKSFLADMATKIYVATDTSTQVEVSIYELCSDMIDVVSDVISIYDTAAAERAERGGEGEEIDMQSTIQLNKGLSLYLRTVNRFLVLVSLVRQSSLEKRGLVDYNFHCFRIAVNDVFAIRHSRPLKHSSSSS